MLLSLIASIAVSPAPGPMATGFQEMASVLKGLGFGSRIAAITAAVDSKLGPEAFAVASDGKSVRIVGGDANGVMYGYLELAERAQNAGAKAFDKGSFSGKPYLRDRGWNIFLPLPWDYAKNNNDPDVAALTDPKRWFFHDDDYWKTLFHQMAWARLNWLDIHGPYDLTTTRFPNLYAYFIQSDKFPEVGVPKDVKAKNLKQLNHIIDMAHNAGVRVSLMSYEARFDVPHNPRPPYKGTEPEVYEYTKEVVEKTVRECPKLDKIGFRIGESGRGEAFFNCYLEAVKASGRDIPVYTRSWITRKAKVVPLARASKDFTVEIKYNGEQWGAPYILQGGRVPAWYSYFWEDYLSDSGNAPAAKMWEGNPDPVGGQQLAVGGSDGPTTRVGWSFDANRTKPNQRMVILKPGKGSAVRSAKASTSPKEITYIVGGTKIRVKTQASPRKAESPAVTRQSSIVNRSTFPAEPYKIVWQVRANGTNRIFPFYQPEYTRRSILAMKIGTASGYTVESMGAYLPQSPDFYRKKPQNAFKWLHQRDFLYMDCWGRFGYDPQTPEWVFDRILARRFGKDLAAPLAVAWKAASRVVPLAYMAYSLGPDHRNHSTEMEWGGDTAQYIVGEPFDTHTFVSINEALGIKATGGHDGRIPVSDISYLMAGISRTASERAQKIASSPPTHPVDRPLVDEIANGITALESLGQYYGAKFSAANALAKYEASGDKDQLSKAADYAQQSANAWGTLANIADVTYKPFTNMLRMGTHSFSWFNELPKIQADADSLAKLLGGPVASTDLPAATMVRPPKTAKLTLKIVQKTVVCTIPSEGLSRAWILYKPLPSTTFFHKKPMVRRGDVFEFKFTREPWGHCVAAEVELKSGLIRRIPWWENERPYEIVASLPAPTPAIYSSEEAMRFLDPNILDPQKYGWLIVAFRGGNFNSFDVPTQRKLLLAVEKGMNLLVMQQDYVSGRYRADYLPIKPQFKNLQSAVFDPGGALGMPKVETDNILSQPVLPTPGWEVFGNGGVARMKHGKGEIWMLQARIIQRMHVPNAAKALLAALQHTAPEIPKAVTVDGSPVRRKQAILVDTGTENATYATSVIPDFMNAHDLPFLTLGELIAKEQGMNSAKVIPGPVTDDAVLGGKGPSIMRSFLEAKVHTAAARPLPKSVDEVEARRPIDRREFMRMMGLDPLPPRTPLNARITGIFRRPGYRVEKLVYESRPGFFVTGLLYVPENPQSEIRNPKYPVILDVHGHWAMKKQQDVVQSRCIFQALHGYIALCIDTPGHSFEADDAPIERRWQGDHNDWTLLLGSANTTALYAWDGIRALDYLETRKECDMDKVGITGASGGGLATLYNFVADERIKVAVPVVYATSLEVNPHNGCLCNHVPGTLQVGDRSDILAIRAPQPILVIGATVDTEFPPAGTQLTGQKLRAIWKLFGKEDDAQWKVFPGGHDYNQSMQELAVGFFDKHLRGIGDGSPVPRPEFKAEPELSPEIQVLGGKTPEGALTQRDIAKQRLKDAKPHSWQEVIKLNGGLPEACPLNWTETPSGMKGKSYVTFQSEKGLTIPAVLWYPAEKAKAAIVLVSEGGKTQAPLEFGVPALVKAGFACLAIDVRGFGELQGLDQRLMTYLGTSDPFAMGWDAACAIRGLRAKGLRTVVFGRGAVAGQAAMFAALFEPKAAGIAASDLMKTWEDAFEEGVSSAAIMPRADLAAPLADMRGWVIPKAEWSFHGDPPMDLAKVFEKLLKS